jgi:hypothetical protein
VAEQDLQSTISDQAAGPVQASGDRGSVSLRPLTEIIEADKYVQANKGVKLAHRGLRVTKMRASGSVL